MVLPRPAARITPAAKLEFSSNDRSEYREAGQMNNCVCHVHSRGFTFSSKEDADTCAYVNVQGVLEAHANSPLNLTIRYEKASKYFPVLREVDKLNEYVCHGQMIGTV
jgi:hypothetical protein